MNKVICTICGEEVALGTKFCHNCGAPIPATAAPAPAFAASERSVPPSSALAYDNSGTYNNSGTKVKEIAKVFAIIGYFFAGIVVIVSFGAMSDMGEVAALGLLGAAVMAVGTWIGWVMLTAYGDLVANSFIQRDLTEQLIAALRSAKQ